MEKCFEQWFRASKHVFQVLRCFMRLRFAHHEYKEKTHTHTHTHTCKINNWAEIKTKTHTQQ